MIENKIVLKAVSEVLARLTNQRSSDSEDHIASIGQSIAQQSLIHAIVIDKNSGRIVSGWTRLKAFMYNAEHGVECQWPSYENWTKIPARYAINVTDEELKAIELEENLKRKDLSWQDEALAIADYHAAMRELNPDHTATATGNNLGLSSAYISKRLQIAAELRAGNEKIQKCTGIQAALTIVNRQNDRAIANEMDQMHDMLHPEEDADDDDGLDEVSLDAIDGQPEVVAEKRALAKPKVIPAEQSILHGDAIAWMADYSGPKFNFLHCDFPYGINHQKSEQGRSEDWGAYEDTPEIFWKLCQELAENCHRFMAHSSHIMFWYSFTYHEQLMEFFRTSMPEWDVQTFPMIWHKSDNKGLLPDPNRYGRRTYEVALCLSRGDRKIVSPIALSYASPGAKSIHLSEKPEPMLRHFFRMFVDEYVSMLDLTCGSGTSLRAAESLGAKYVFGIEMDETNHINAVSELARSRNLAALSDEV